MKSLDFSSLNEVYASEYQGLPSLEKLIETYNSLKITLRKDRVDIARHITWTNFISSVRRNGYYDLPREEYIPEMCPCLCCRRTFQEFSKEREVEISRKQAEKARDKTKPPKPGT